MLGFTPTLGQSGVATFMVEVGVMEVEKFIFILIMN
jgi:hypothetical protein